jgi:hypothetical protein
MSSRRLMSEERQRLLERVACSPRTLLLYTLAERLDVGARQLAALDLGDVTSDGHSVRLSGRIASTGSHEDLLLAMIRQYLAWRCACPHLRLRLRTYRDPRGVERCHACHDDLRLPANPLLRSRWNRRLSPKQMRHEFIRHRDALAIDKDLTFESLRPSPTGERAAGT